MKKLGKILFIFAALFIVGVNSVKADNSEEIAKIEAVLQKKLDEKFKDGKMKITLADSVWKSDYEKGIKEGNIDKDEMSYEVYARGAIFEAQDFLKEVIFGDDYEVDTGFKRSDGTKIIATASVNPKYNNIEVPNGTDPMGNPVTRMEMEIDRDIMVVSYSFELVPFSCDSEGMSCGGVGSSVSKELKIEDNYIKADSKILADIEYYRKEMAKVETLNYRDLYWINMLLATDLGGFQSDIMNFENAQFLTGYFTKYKEGVKMGISNRMGAIMQFESIFGGEFPVFYNNVLYDILSSNLGGGKNFMIGYKQIIEIPNTTTSDKYIEVAKKRIDDYINNKDIEATIVKTDKTFQDYLDDEDAEVNPDIATENTLPDVYKLTLKNKVTGVSYDHFFLIEKVEEDKIVTPVVQYLEETSKIIMETKSSDVPQNSVIKVNTVEEKEALDKIKLYLDSDKLKAFDITLESFKSIIKTINNGYVTVKIPLPDGFDEKVTKIYYVSDDGKKKDEFDVRYETIDEVKYIVFDTTHFSTYVIADTTKADPVKEDTPNTLDNIVLYVSLGVLSLIGITGSVMYLKKKMN